MRHRIPPIWGSDDRLLRLSELYPADYIRPPLHGINTPFGTEQSIAALSSEVFWHVDSIRLIFGSACSLV